MGTAMGQTPEQAANMSKSLVGLAGDLASFKNIGIDQAQEALKGIFTGEGESLKSLGVIMQDSTLEAYALATGQKKAYDEMTQAEKVALRYSFVMDATKNAQGDFARTSDGSANQMRIFQESLKELGVQFGQVLLPAFTAIVTKINEFVGWLGTLDPGLKNLIVVGGLLVAAIGPLLLIIGGMATGFSAVAGVLAGISAPVLIVIAAITALGIAFALLWNNNETFRNTMIALWEGIKTSLLVIWDSIKIIALAVWGGLQLFWETWGGTITAFFQNLWNGISGIIGGAFTIIQGIFEVFSGIFTGDWDRAWNGIKDILTGVWDVISSVFTTTLNAISLLFTTVWNTIKDNVLMPVYNWLTETFKPVFNVIWEVFGLALGLILVGIETVWNKIKDNILLPVYNWLVDTLKPVWDTISGVFNTALDIISKKISDIWDGIKDKILLPVYNWIVDTFKPVFDTVKNGLETAWGGLKTFASGIWDGITETLKTAVNGWIGLINWAIKKINSIKIEVPKVSVPGMGDFGGYTIGFPSIPEIPALAKGGIVNSPTLAMIGERGAEAIVPLENTSFVDKISSAIGSAVLNAMQFTNGNNSSNGSIILNIDGTTIARVLNPYIEKESLRIGNKVIIQGA